MQCNGNRNVTLIFSWWQRSPLCHLKHKPNAFVLDATHATYYSVCILSKLTGQGALEQRRERKRERERERERKREGTQTH